MKIIAISSAYDRRGGAPVSNVAYYLRQFIAPAAPVDLTLEAVSFHLSTGPTRPTLETLRDRFEARYKRLPHLRCLRKANKITLDYPSALPSDAVLAYGKTHPRTFRVVLDELRRAIEGSFTSSHSVAALVDVPALRDALAQAVSNLPQSEEAISLLVESIEAARKVERFQPMTMERLPIDWSRFHPNARTILNDPFYWDEMDEDAPHGNDTGADLLPEFRRWRARHRTDNPIDFLNAVLERWDLLDDGPTVLEAEIGLAFAQIKLEGRCDPEVAARALIAIDRRLIDVANDSVRVSRVRRLRARVLLLTAPTSE